MSCQNNANCVSTYNNSLRFPVAQSSLYEQNIYDDEHSRRTCQYKDNGANYVEPFGIQERLTSKNLLMIALVLLVIYLMYVSQKNKTYDLGILSMAESGFSMI
jgi:hypothetical protein